MDRIATSESKQDVLADDEHVLVELDDGSRLIEIEGERYRDPPTFRVETLYDDPKPIDDETRGRLYLVLYRLVDGFSRPESVAPTIPVEIALEGKPAIAVYLYAVRGWDSDDVADRLGVIRPTVWDYFSRVRSLVDEQGGDQ